MLAATSVSLYIVNPSSCRRTLYQYYDPAIYRVGDLYLYTPFLTESVGNTIFSSRLRLCGTFGDWHGLCIYPYYRELYDYNDIYFTAHIHSSFGGKWECFDLCTQSSCLLIFRDEGIQFAGAGKWSRPKYQSFNATDIFLVFFLHLICCHSPKKPTTEP